MTGFDKAALERLMTLGRKRGHLTTGDLENELPVSAMSPDELALVIVHLEEAGVPVELDAALLAPGGGAPAPEAGGFVLPQPATTHPPARPQEGSGAAPVAAAATRPGASGSEGSWSRAHLAVMIAGLVVVALLAAVLAIVNLAHR